MAGRRIARWPSSCATKSEQGRFCRVCRSHFCPHAAPWVYDPAAFRPGRLLALVEPEEA
jgi:hypothetical protein